MAHIIVSATALAYSGALTILTQFVNYAGADSSNTYVIFIPEKILLPLYSNVQLVTIKKQSWLKRIMWDSFLLKKYIKSHNVKYEVVISLQNTSLNLPGRKLIYLHQSIPFYDIQIPLISKTNFKLWCYKHFYYYFIILHVDRNTEFIVQTEWMKNLLCRKTSLSMDKVHVIRPEMNFIEKRIKRSNKRCDEFELIYPATPMFYKNHALILHALLILKNKYKIVNVKLHVTFAKDSDKYFTEHVKNYDVENNLIYHGYLPRQELLELYLRANVMVFPSYVETYGLPLLEGAGLGLYILASDLPYAREVLEGYNGVEFVDYQSADDWAEKIYSLYMNRSKTEQTTPFKVDNSSSWIKLSELY